MSFSSSDGLIDIAEIVTLAKEIDKFAAKQGLKPNMIYFSPRLIPKYDAAKAKAGGELFIRKRNKPIKTKTRMPVIGARVQMQILLRNYKGLDQTATWGEKFEKPFKKAVAAIESHNKKVDAWTAKYKETALRKREKANAEFDKNIDAVSEILGKAGVKESNIVIGSGIGGKSMVVKLPNGGYVAVGKADAERFNKAKDARDNPQEKKAFGRPKASSSSSSSKSKPTNVVDMDEKRRERRSSSSSKEKDKKSSSSSSKKKAA